MVTIYIYYSVYISLKVVFQGSACFYNLVSAMDMCIIAQIIHILIIEYTFYVLLK